MKQHGHMANLTPNPHPLRTFHDYMVYGCNLCGLHSARFMIKPMRGLRGFQLGFTKEFNVSNDTDIQKIGLAIRNLIVCSPK